LSTNTTTKTLQLWRRERGCAPDTALFPTRTGRPLSRDAIEHRSPYAGIAAGHCPSIGEKKVTANVLHHTAAMRLLEAGVDTSVIAPEFADLDLKERALD
jgi:integrase